MATLQTKTISDTASKGRHKFSLKVVENSVNKTDNTSSISFAFSIEDVTGGYDWSYSNQVPVSYTVKIAGKTYTGSIMKYDGYGKHTLKSDTFTVKHNNDGSKSISYSFSVTTNLSASYLPGSASNSGSMTLTKIPRASSLSLSATSVNVGSTITANISRNSTSYVHDVVFYINDNYTSGKYTKISTSKSFTIPASWYKYMPASTSCTAYCKITTRNSSGTQIGDSVTKSFTVKVPDSVKPTIGTIKLTPKDYSSQFPGMLIQGKNKLTMSVSGCSAGTESSIKSYTFSGPGISTTTSNTTVTSASNISSYGTLTYTLTVTDKRGRTASKTATIYCYQYYTPSVTITPYRSDQFGTKTDGGQYIWCKYSASFAPVNKLNTISITLHGAEQPTSSIVTNDKLTSGEKGVDLGTGKEDVTYKVYAKITDALGGSTTTSTFTVYGAQKVLNIYKDGTGVAIGKKSSGSNLFECRWPAVFDGAISGTAGVNTSSDRRIKKNIKNTDLNIVHKLQPVEYQLIDDETGRVHYGFIAQDIVKILTEAGIDPVQSGLIGTVPNKDFEQLTLSYTEFIPLLVNDNQRLQQELTDMRNELKELKQLILKGRD